MKALKRCLVLVGVLLLFGLSTTNVNAEYLGEFCWNVADSHGTVGMVKIGITHMGGNHYLVQGGASGDDIYFSGSGLLVGGKIVFSMSGTHTEERSGEIRKNGNSWEVTIDLTTLNGPFWTISTEYFADGTTNVHYGEGTWEYTSCQ